MKACFEAIDLYERTHGRKPAGVLISSFEYSRIVSKLGLAKGDVESLLFNNVMITPSNDLWFGEYKLFETPVGKSLANSGSTKNVKGSKAGAIICMYGERYASLR